MKKSLHFFLLIACLFAPTSLIGMHQWFNWQYFYEKYFTTTQTQISSQHTAEKQPKTIQPKAQPYNTSTSCKKNKNQLSKSIIDAILFAKSITYHALFIILQTDMQSAEDLYNIDTRYMTGSLKEIDRTDCAYYVLADALDDINFLLSKKTNKLPKKYIWYLLTTCMYRVYTIVGIISTPFIVSKEAKQCLNLLAHGNKKNYYTWEQAKKEHTTKTVSIIFKHLGWANKQLLEVLIPFFAGSNRFPKNKNEILVAYEEDFPYCNILSLSTHNKLFTTTKLPKNEYSQSIKNLYRTLKNEYQESS